MRHSEEFGLLNYVDDSDEKLKTKLPKDAVAELKKASNKVQPASFLCTRIIENMPAKTEFTVNDIYVLLHLGEKRILVKMPTLRSTLSTMVRNPDALFEVATQTGKHRLYRKK